MGVRSRLTKAVLNLVPRDHDISNVTSRELVRNKDLAVILHTCDAYEFCWTGWHFYFSRHWDTKLDCNIYFANESSACNFPDVSHLPTGSGPWADRRPEPRRRRLALAAGAWPSLRCTGPHRPSSISTSISPGLIPMARIGAITGSIA